MTKRSRRKAAPAIGPRHELVANAVGWASVSSPPLTADGDLGDHHAARGCLLWGRLQACHFRMAGISRHS